MRAHRQCLALPARAGWAAFLLAWCVTVSPHAQSFTVSDALSAPFSNELTAAPAHARVAWVTDSQGRRNVWVGGVHQAAHPVTQFAEDDGQDIDALAWSRDGERLAWTRGTGAQGPEHPVANPAELPGRVQQLVWFADLRTGVTHAVAEGHAPLFSSDGNTLYFLRRGAIWVASLRGDLSPERRNHAAVSEASPASRNPPSSGSLAQTEISGQEPASPGVDAPGVHQLLFVRGTASSLRLSPDGTRILFVSARGDHSFIGVYTFATRTLQWMDPGVGLDHDALWSPDGTSIAFIREVPIVSPIADRWLRAGAPWSIHVADASTGQGREVWTADPGAGSLFHAVSAHDQLTWTPDGRIVFPWEKGGWTRMYALTLQPPTITGLSPLTGTTTLLTPGEFEVDCVAANGGTLLFSANEQSADPADVDRRHVWALNLLASSAPRVLAGGTGIETEPAVLSDGTPAMMAGTAQQPLVPMLLSDTGRRTLLAPELVPATFPATRFGLPQPVIFPAADGLPIHGQLFLPSNVKPGARLPAVVFFHGGSRRQMLLGFHPMQYYAQAYEFNQYLANQGFAVLSVNYRSGTGYGLDFRQALNYGANGASEDNDVIGAAKYLATRPDIDPKRIGAWGGSYGGYLTALALARHSDLYAAGVDLHGVHDWSLELDLWKPTDEPGADQSAIAHRAFHSSPLASIDRWKSPVLLMQGDDDRNVLFAQTVRLAAELRARHVPVEVEVFPDEVHDFLLQRTWIKAYEHAYAFLKSNLQQP